MPDSWEEGKPEEEVPERKNPAVSRYVEIVGEAIKPCVPLSLVSLADSVPLFIVKDRDELKTVATAANKQQVITEAKELFQYDASRNLWLRIS